MNELFDLIRESKINVKKLEQAESELADLRIRAPIEGGPEYKSALERFNKYVHSAEI